MSLGRTHCCRRSPIDKSWLVAKRFFFFLETKKWSTLAESLNDPIKGSKPRAHSRCQSQPRTRSTLLMSDNERRVGSPVPSQSLGNGSMAGSITGRNRAASTTKSVLSVGSKGTVRNSPLQLVGSRKINVAPRMSFSSDLPSMAASCLHYFGRLPIVSVRHSIAKGFGGDRPFEAAVPMFAVRSTHKMQCSAHMLLCGGDHST